MSAPALVVALTGGIAAGKSAVTGRFQRLGVPVYDADVAAREVIAPGTLGLAAVVHAFGAKALGKDGALDRPAMRKRVFAEVDARRKLEAIIHPRVRQWLRRHAAHCADAYCILAIPLLAESRAQYRWVDRVLVVDVPETVQLARLLARDGIDQALAQRIVGLGRSSATSAVRCHPHGGPSALREPQRPR